MIKWAPCIAMTLALAGVCSADSAEDRSKLWGNWKSAEGSSAGETLVLGEQNGKLHYQHTQSNQDRAEFDCNTMGRDCKVKADGKDATVSFYFNGPRLVQWEKVGDKVVKRRFSIVNGDTLEVETTSVVPNGKPETTRLKRASDSEAVAANGR